MSEKPTKKTFETDALRPEYDFSSLKVVARGSGRAKHIYFELDEDVAKVFHSEREVNEARRSSIRLEGVSLEEKE